MASVTRWRIYCLDEGEWTYGYLTTGANAPTTCFTNTAHSVNADSSQELDVISQTTVKAKIVEELIETGGYFRCEGHKFSIPANSTAIQQVSWPYPITVLQSFYEGGPEHEGNELDVIVGPNTIVGILREAASIGDTVLHVSLTVIQNIKIGFTVKLGSTTVGSVIGINENMLCITITAPLAAAYNANTYVKTEALSISNLEFGRAPIRISIGASKHGGKYLAPNTLVELTYKNNTNADVVFKYQVEILY